MFHLRASVALGRGKSPARAARIALIKLRRVRVARPWALGGLDGSSHGTATYHRRITHLGTRARCACVATGTAAGGGAWPKLKIRMREV